MFAHELLSGRALYADIWDHKPPALHATYALGELLAGYGPASVYLLNVLAAGATLLAVYAAGAAVGGRAAGLWAAAFWAVISGDLWLEANQPNTEAFINASVVWAFALLVRAGPRPAGLGPVLAIGALLAVGSLYKHVVAVTAALLALAHVASPPGGPAGRRRALGDVAIMAAVGLAAWALVVGYFVAVGRFEAFNDAVFTYNRFYADSPVRNLVLSLRQEKLLPGVLRSAVPLACLALAGAIAGAVKGPQRAWTLALALALGTHVAIALPGQPWPHYYQLWLPPLAIMAGWAIGLFAGIVRERFAWVPHAAGAAALALLLIAELPFYQIPADDWSKIKYGPLFVLERGIARELDTLLAPEETFYVWGSEVELYYATRRRPPCGACLAWPMWRGPLRAGLSARTVADLEREQPDLFLIAGWTWLYFRGQERHPVLRWFSTRYRPFPGGADRGPFTLFIRRGGRLEARIDRARGM